MAKKKSTSRATAESMASKQREISVSEFFAKNRHLLGFDNPRKALLTTIKEAVDNALDACEEAEILPDIEVKIEELEAPPSADQTGTVQGHHHRQRAGHRSTNQIENIFGKLLYGSKFHRLKMSRGQQGIGISAAGMYGLMTTGKPMVIHTKPNKKKPAHHIELAMDTSKNQPEVTVDVETDDFPETSTGTGNHGRDRTRSAIPAGQDECRGVSRADRDRQPARQDHVHPAGQSERRPDTRSQGADEAKSEQGESPSEIVRTAEYADRIEYPRTINELPTETQEIKPHPYGVELGNFLGKLKTTEEKQLAGSSRTSSAGCLAGCRQGGHEEAASTSKKSITGQTWI